MAMKSIMDKKIVVNLFNGIVYREENISGDDADQRKPSQEGIPYSCISVQFTCRRWTLLLEAGMAVLFGE